MLFRSVGESGGGGERTAKSVSQVFQRKGIVPAVLSFSRSSGTERREGCETMATLITCCERQICQLLLLALPLHPLPRPKKRNDTHIKRQIKDVPSTVAEPSGRELLDPLLLEPRNKRIEVRPRHALRVLRKPRHQVVRPIVERVLLESIAREVLQEGRD